jgi:predicted ATPase
MGLDDFRRFMGCPDTETLAAYAEDALALEGALRVAAHENQCPVCRADIAELRGVIRRGLAPLLAAMPLWATPFVGREELRASLTETLTSGNTSLLTLAAPPGTGKTRLTLETAVEQSSLFPDGVWYVSVNGAPDVTVTAAEIARAVRLRLEPKAPPIEQLVSFLNGKRALLVLDDVPAASPAAQVVAELTRRTSDCVCLAMTSGAFGAPGERTIPLPPLQTLQRSSLTTHRSPDELLSSESLQLFAAHVRTFQPGYRFDEPDLLSAVGICEQAGGMPLGIELAAARVREMSPEDILSRLRRRAAPPDNPIASLDEMIAWSCDLLTAREQKVLSQLSVFAGGFFVEQAAAVCEEDDAPQLIESLEQKAMLQRADALGRVRYQLLAPIREFARRRLGERDWAAKRRHALYFLKCAQERDALLSGPQQVEAMAETSTDLLNLRAGMDWAERAGEWHVAGGYGLALSQFLIRHGLWTECSYRLRVASLAFHRAKDRRQHQEAALELARCLTFRGEYQEAETLFNAVAAEAAQRGDADTLAEARHGLGNVAQFRGHYAEATQRFEEVLKRFAASGDRWRIADCYHNLGWLAWRQGDYQRAESWLKNSLAIQRERGDRYRLGTTLATLGNIAFEQGRLDEARQWFEESLRARQELGDARGIASAVNNMGMIWQALGDDARAEYCFAKAARDFERLGDRRDLGQVIASQGDLALAQGDLARARERFETALKILEAAGDAHSRAQVLRDFGRVAQQEGRRAEAAQLYRESLTQLHALGDVANLAVALYHCGQLLWEEGDEERAMLLLNVALTLCTERRRQERAKIEAALSQMEERIGAEQATLWRQRAMTLTLDEAVALALRQ